jgi:pyridoxine 4-dehydrogenase
MLTPVMLPIPDTRSVAHLTDNLAVAQIQLPDEDVAAITSLAAEA